MVRSWLSRLQVGTVAAASIAALASPATAQDDPELRDIILEQQRQIEELQGRTPGEPAPPPATKQAPSPETGRVEVDYEDGPSPTIEFYEMAEDGTRGDLIFDFKVRGRVQIDVGWVDPKEGDTADDVATECRRCRLGVEGTAWQDFGYRFEVDFADDEVDVTDAFIDYSGLDAAAVTVGQFKTPNSLEELTSSRFITFAERAAFVDAFDLNRRIGLGFEGDLADAGTWAVGVFGQNIDVTTDLDEGYAAAARGTYAIDLGEAPTPAEERLVHLGGSARFRNLDNDADNGTVRYRALPEVHTTDRFFVDTGDLEDVDSDLFIGPEFALVWDQLSVQSEGGWTFVDRGDEFDDGLVWGAYLDASYFLTPNSRRYDGGEFGRVKFQEGQALNDGGIGAWQVALRFDYINLNDADAGIDGGEQWSLVPAVNWWPSRHIRFWLDFAYNHITGGTVPPNGPGGDNEVYAAAFRSQVDF